MEIDYFSKSYGNFFNAISDVELEPLFKFEATLLYSF